MKQFWNKLSQRGRYILIACIAFLVIIFISILSIINNNNNDPDTSESVTTGDTSQTSDSESSNPNTVETTPIPVLGNVKQYVSKITGYEEQVANLPDIEDDTISIQLNGTLELNGVSKAITDATIREGSYSQKLTDASKMIYLTNFIVDIPSIGQSYVVTNYYSPLSPEISGLTDYTTLVTCPDSSQLIYGDFNCIDRFMWENQDL